MIAYLLAEQKRPRWRISHFYAYTNQHSNCHTDTHPNTNCNTNHDTHFHSYIHSLTNNNLHFHTYLPPKKPKDNNGDGGTNGSCTDPFGCDGGPL